MKKLWAAVTVAVLSLASAACGGSGSGSSEDTINIGAVLAVTGLYADQGLPSQKGLQLAIDEANAAGGVQGKTVQLNIKDTAADPQQAVSAVTQFAADPKILAIIGPSTSAEGPAVAPIVNQRKIPLIAATAISDSIVTEGPWGFRVRVAPSVTATFISGIMVEKLKVKNVSIVYPQDNQGSVAVAETAQKVLEGKGVNVTLNAVQSTDTNFASVITKIQGQAPDAIYCPCPVAIGAPFFAQAREGGIPASVQFLGEFYNISPQFVQLGGAAVQGAGFPSDYSPDYPGSTNQAFVNAYRAKYNEPPDSQAAAGYTAGQLLITALKNITGDITRETLRDALEGVTSMPSVLGQGTWRQDAQHIASLDLLYVTLEGEKFVPAP